MKYVGGLLSKMFVFLKKIGPLHARNVSGGRSHEFSGDFIKICCGLMSVVA
jgi:hypothetical protein